MSNLQTITNETTFQVRECPDCGIAYGAPERFFNERRKDGKKFYCPNGHCLSWHETEADRLRRELKNEQGRSARWLAALDQKQAELEHVEARRRAEKAAKTRLKNRVTNGVCPCCNRSFANLRRHMESQHPDYAAND